MPLAPLVAAAAYPFEPDSVAPGTIESLLRKTGLGHRLDAGTKPPPISRSASNSAWR